MTTVVYLQCENCMRRGPDINIGSVSYAAVRRKNQVKYYNIKERRHEAVMICSHCNRYLFEVKKRPGDYWPAMVYCFLTYKSGPDILDVPFRDRWKLLPREWRIWWEYEFNDIIGEETECLFRDVTKQLARAEVVLEELKWKDLSKFMDEHLAYPEIRCPFGCCEFLSRTNGIPLEGFLFHYSNYSMPSYWKPEGKVWTDCISPSYPSACLILERFECYPAVAITDDGPIILSCREHNRHSNDRYLHVPESPTGTIYTSNANGIASVVLRSRTNRNYKQNVCSDTYQTVQQVGGYNGLDCAYLTTANSLSRCDALSSMRDALSIYGRPDIREQLNERSRDIDSPSFLPRRTVDDMIKFAEAKYSDCWPLPEMETSTFIPMDCAIRLSERVKDEGSKTLDFYADRSTDAFVKKLFTPPWPTFIVPVHTTDGYGERFERVTCSNGLGIWMLLCITGRVTDVWEAVCDSVTDNKAWNGHWLRYASKELNFRGCSKRSEFFKSDVKIPELFPMPLDVLLRNFEATKSLFRSCGSMLVVEHEIPDDADLGNQWGEKEIIICVNPKAGLQEHSSEIYELRCLLSSKLVQTSRTAKEKMTRVMHVRHRGQKFWVQDGERYCSRCNGGGPGSGAWQSALVAVYCRKTLHASADLHRRYMNVIGGQNSVYCGLHGCPLIINHERKNRASYISKCICDRTVQEIPASGNGQVVFSSCGSRKCEQYATHVCPQFKSCKTAICKLDLRSANDACARLKSGTVLYLSKEDSAFRERGGNDGGAILADEGYMGDNMVLPEALGPTAGHELPLDTFEDENSDEEEAKSDRYVDPDPSAEVGYEAYPNDFDMDFVAPGDEMELDPIIADEMELDPVTADEMELDPFSTNGIPCSRVGSGTLPIRMETPDRYDNSSVNMNLYVIFNQHGNVLTRARSKAKMSKTHQALCQRIVANSTSKVVPLVYAEAQLFPSIFWQSMEDGTIPGALPTALWSDASYLKQLRIASLRSHSKNRITNPRLLCSTDPSYQFMSMDLLVNLAARQKDTRIILHRGFADNQGTDGIKFKEKCDTAELYGESTENHANVHKLSALVQERNPHYFLTQSCNQQSCRGLRVLREWIKSDEAKFLIQDRYGVSGSEAAYFLGESAASYVLRSWNEVADIWMKYIIYSEEEPLGKIEYAWYRKEFQEVEGNPSHIHAILRTIYDINDPKDLEKVLSKVRGCIRDLLHDEEVAEFKRLGIISSADHLLDLLQQAKTFLTHRCHERCQIPRQDGNGNVTFVCKVSDNSLRSSRPFQHTLAVARAEHTASAKAIYNRLGMMRGDEVIEQCLSSRFHVPITERKDRKFSPTNGHLFACYPSSQNLQFCTGHTIAQYLVKYIAAVDEVAIVVVRPQQSEVNNYSRAEIESLHNTKITSNKILAEKKKASVRHRARILTQMECLTVILGSPLVTSTVKFVYIPTSPREYRAAFFKHGREGQQQRRLPDHIEADVVVGQEIRTNKGFLQPRMFSSFQIAVIQDEQKSALSICAITIFSIRPPELRFVNNVFSYFRWFERQRIDFNDYNELRDELKARLKDDIGKCQWIDGMNMQVTVRRGAVTEILSYIEEECQGPSLFGSNSSRSGILKLFRTIAKLLKQFETPVGQTTDQSRGRRAATHESSRQQYETLCHDFVSTDKSNALPTVWTTAVYPKNVGRFLVYILLLFGRFETEYELMKQGSMREAYIHAGLLRRGTVEEEKLSLDELLTKYVRRALSYQSGSVLLHDNNLVFAEAAFLGLLEPSDNRLTGSVIMPIGTPCVLQSHMEEETTEKVRTERRLLLETFIGTLIEDLMRAGFNAESLPDRDALLGLHCACSTSGDVPYTFPPQRTSRQSMESYIEQRRVLLKAKAEIDAFRSHSLHKNLILCGGPGNGKTTVCQEICLYAFSKGLNGIATSIVADRSKSLGGVHIHLLTALQGSERHKMSPGGAAQNAIAALYRRPELLYFWQRLEFLYIDEFGVFSAELLATVDIIVRHVKQSSRYMGGMLIIGTMDVCQLLPFSGTALLLSMSIMNEYNFVELNQSVRAANDKDLRDICELSRTIHWTEEKKEEFKKLIRENCKFVDAIDSPDLPEDGIFVFGRKSPCRKAEELMLKRVKEKNGENLVLSRCLDEESSLAGNWKPASIPVIRALSRKVKRKEELYLFRKGRYEFTYNLRGAFQQGQLAILLDFDEEDVLRKRPLGFFRGPPGCKEFPLFEDFTPTRLEALGWKLVSVPWDQSKPTRIMNNLVARRGQYGVRLRVASTIHASMGSTFGKMITAVSNNSQYPDLDFTLWEAAQAVVLISRTRTCSDMYFIGDPEDVARSLLGVLTTTTRYLPYIRSLAQMLCNEDSVTPALVQQPHFRPSDIVIEPIPAVYLLVSTRKPNCMYIGETDNIRRRLHHHNSGRGSVYTNQQELRPWALFGYVYGFSDRRERLRFEASWKHCGNANRNASRRTPPGLMQISHGLASQKNTYRIEGRKLRVQICGVMEA